MGKKTKKKKTKARDSRSALLWLLFHVFLAATQTKHWEGKGVPVAAARMALCSEQRELISSTCMSSKAVKLISCFLLSIPSFLLRRRRRLCVGQQSVCNVNCHKKCERHMPNLCGVNQKLLAEALSSVKRGIVAYYTPSPPSVCSLRGLRKEGAHNPLSRTTSSSLTIHLRPFPPTLKCVHLFSRPPSAPFVSFAAVSQRDQIRGAECIAGERVLHSSDSYRYANCPWLVKMPVDGRHSIIINGCQPS